MRLPLCFPPSPPNTSPPPFSCEQITSLIFSPLSPFPNAPSSCFATLLRRKIKTPNSSPPPISCMTICNPGGFEFQGHGSPYMGNPPPPPPPTLSSGCHRRREVKKLKKLITMENLIKS
ncbi:hypothetical protein KSP39_PZI005913 [Platanthera zijinensis]|uniref:Uncharacterized protein n=1 Tax=Platanthera zijinensis TaxID=2320716 RepID=A0AAP0GB60_9ASPA